MSQDLTAAELCNLPMNCPCGAMPGDGTCPKLLEPPARSRTAREAMDRESRQQSPSSRPSSSSSSSSSSSQSRVGTGLVWILRNSKPTCSSRTSPILAWLPNAPRTLHLLISQPPSTTLCSRS